MADRKFVRIVHEIELEITDQDRLTNYALQMIDDVGNGESGLSNDESIEITALNAYQRFLSRYQSELSEAGMTVVGAANMHRVEEQGRYVELVLPAWAVRNGDGEFELPLIDGADEDRS